MRQSMYIQSYSIYDALQAQQKQSLPMIEYNIWAYLAYVYYPPLYIAGPICTFNAFARQCRQSSTIQRRQVCRRLIVAVTFVSLMLTAVKYTPVVQLQSHGHKISYVTSRSLLWLMHYVLKMGPLQVVFYAMRLAFSMLLLEIMSHTLYFNSITRYSLWRQYGAQLQLTAVDMGMISFWVLMFMWLKVSFSYIAAMFATCSKFYAASHVLIAISAEAC